MRKLIVGALAAASLLTVTAGLMTESASSAPAPNEMWCYRTGEGVLNCEYKTRAACDFILELVTLPGATCVRNPNRR
jgi:hypothetical protein